MHGEATSSPSEPASRESSSAAGSRCPARGHRRSARLGLRAIRQHLHWLAGAGERGHRAHRQSGRRWPAEAAGETDGRDRPGVAADAGAVPSAAESRPGAPRRRSSGPQGQLGRVAGSGTGVVLDAPEIPVNVATADRPGEGGAGRGDGRVQPARHSCPSDHGERRCAVIRRHGHHGHGYAERAAASSSSNVRHAGSRQAQPVT